MLNHETEVPATRADGGIEDRRRQEGPVGWTRRAFPRDLTELGRIPLAAGTLLSVALWHRMVERRPAEPGDDVA